MKPNQFIHALLVPKTGLYILLGTVIMFLTFLTDNNAMEIAISGIASIFIGIGVNNFTSAETHEKDKAIEHTRIALAIQSLEQAKHKIALTVTLLEKNMPAEQATADLEEFILQLQLNIDYIRFSESVK